MSILKRIHRSSIHYLNTRNLYVSKFKCLYCASREYMCEHVYVTNISSRLACLAPRIVCDIYRHKENCKILFKKVYIFDKWFLSITRITRSVPRIVNPTLKILITLTNNILQITGYLTHYIRVNCPHIHTIIFLYIVISNFSEEKISLFFTYINLHYNTIVQILIK